MMLTTKWILVCSSISLLLYIAVNFRRILTWLNFAYACFLQPIDGNDQKARLDRFYRSQAQIYDNTRSWLLAGRESLLRLTAAEIKARRASGQLQRPLIWVDIGGGTGFNIEQMQACMPIEEFDAVFLVDLCEPLLAIARKRFEAQGWKNVHILCQDATSFALPDWCHAKFGADLQLALVTTSYALSMMPDHYVLVDRIERFMHPAGLVSVCDFYVSGKSSTNTLTDCIGDFGRQCSWLSRLFWIHWFEFDHVDLHPSRRQYLEFKFGTIKSVNQRNRLGGLFKVPYYLWLGCKASNIPTFNLTSFGEKCPISPQASPLLVAEVKDEAIPSLTLGSPMEKTISNSVRIRIPDSPHLNPYSSFYYQRKHHRVPYVEGPDQKQFRSFIYGFTWEDPVQDMLDFGFNADDVAKMITSAGDNILHYAIHGQPKQLHCVDMNPCQGHLLELKLAGIRALEYGEFWQLFGEGRHNTFTNLLETKLSPLLSSHAYQFWSANVSYFDTSLYLQGYSGWALQALHYVFRLTGLSSYAEKFANAPDLDTQRWIWRERLRPALLNKWIVKILMANPIFLWNALGVPINQSTMLLNETTIEQYVYDTFDPIAENVHIRDSNYHYYLALALRYNKMNPPAYLSKDGFDKLKHNGLDNILLHTDSLMRVMEKMEPGTLTLFHAMDSYDWFTNSRSKSPSALGAMNTSISSQTISTHPEDPCELLKSVKVLHRTLKTGGRIFWRSAAVDPWYAQVFEENGFSVQRIAAREIGADTPIDMVNMYASFWKAIKI